MTSVSGESGVALGQNASSEAQRAIAIGKDATATDTDTAVIALAESNVFDLDEDGNLSIAGDLTENANL